MLLPTSLGALPSWWVTLRSIWTQTFTRKVGLTWHWWILGRWCRAACSPPVPGLCVQLTTTPTSPWTLGCLLATCLVPCLGKGPALGRPASRREVFWTGITRDPEHGLGEHPANLGTPLSLGRGVAGACKVWGSGLEPRLPCCESRAYKSLGNKGDPTVFPVYTKSWLPIASLDALLLSFPPPPWSST